MKSNFWLRDSKAFVTYPKSLRGSLFIQFVLVFMLLIVSAVSYQTIVASLLNHLSVFSDSSLYASEHLNIAEATQDKYFEVIEKRKTELYKELIKFDINPKLNVFSSLGAVPYYEPEVDSLVLRSSINIGNIVVYCSPNTEDFFKYYRYQSFTGNSNLKPGEIIINDKAAVSLFGSSKAAVGQSLYLPLDRFVIEKEFPDKPSLLRHFKEYKVKDIILNSNDFDDVSDLPPASLGLISSKGIEDIWVNNYVNCFTLAKLESRIDNNFVKKLDSFNSYYSKYIEGETPDEELISRFFSCRLLNEKDVLKSFDSLILTLKYVMFSSMIVCGISFIIMVSIKLEREKNTLAMRRILGKSVGSLTCLIFFSLSRIVFSALFLATLFYLVATPLVSFLVYKGVSWYFSSMFGLIFGFFGLTEVIILLLSFIFADILSLKSIKLR